MPDYKTQEIIKESLLSKVNDKRVVRSIHRVFDAAKSLHSNKHKVTKAAIADYIIKNFDGIPAVGTLNNDKSGYYSTIIDSFNVKQGERLLPNNATTLDSPEKLYADIVNLQKLITKKDRYIGTLKETIRINFENSNSFSTETFMKNDGASLQDGIVEDSDLKLAAQGFKVLLKHMVDAELLMVSNTDKSAIIADNETAEVILRGKQAKAVLDCLANSEED